MGRVFKKTVAKPLPDGAELFEKQGERFARWQSKRGRKRTAPVAAGPDGADRVLIEVGYWYARYRDHAGKTVERSTGCRDESAARQVLARWEREAERVRAGILSPDEEQMSRHQAG